MCRILAQLTRLLRLEPDCLEAHAASLKVVCKQQRVHSPVLAKALVSLYVQARCLCSVLAWVTTEALGALGSRGKSPPM